MAAEQGEETAEVLRLPLVYQGEAVGQLIIGSREPGDALAQSDLQLLKNIAYQAGPAVRAVQLTSALRHSRLQLVTAREEERRRLRRELHDGLGSTMAALNLQIGALRRSIRSDPKKAEGLADEFRQDIKNAIGDIRNLAKCASPTAA